MTKVSVVVPVWNPGPNLTRCLDSLLGQTLDAADYEIVLVDDGSSDGTAARLDALAAEHPGLVVVEHIPRSGWPGRPRNVGVARARGEYVQFVDNDDVLAPDALEALYALGASSAADVVVGKLSSDFRGVNHTVFRNTVTHRTIADFPLVETLTPHKMFRRAFLAEHGIAFPEGPTHLEDQVYVMRAYVQARSVAVLADRPAYFYLRRIGSGRNAGDVVAVPDEYYAALEGVLDVIDAAVPPGELRDALYRRFYRVELLGRLAGPAMARYAPEYRDELVSAVRGVLRDRVGPGVHERSGAATRAQGYLARRGDVAGLVDLAEQFEAVQLVAHGRGTHWSDGCLALDVDACLHWQGAPLRCERTSQGWALPAALAPEVPERERLLSDAVAASDAELSVVRRVDSVSFGHTDGLQVRLDSSGRVRVTGSVRIDPLRAAGGHPLTEGVWDLRLRLRFAGWSRGAALAAPPGRQRRAPVDPLLSAVGVLIPYWTRPNPTLALDVGQWSHSLAAETSRTSSVTVRGRRLHIALSAWSSPGRSLPDATVFLAADGAGALPVPAQATRTADGRLAVTAALPDAADGLWRASLRLGDPGTAAAVALPLALRVRGRRWVEERG